MNQGRRGLLGAGAALTLLALNRCAARTVALYRLATISGGPHAGITARIAVRSVSVPGYLDGNEIDGPGDAYQVKNFPNAQWAEALSDMLQAVLIGNLTQRLPAATVVQDGSTGAAPDMVVQIDISRFDFDADGALHLTAQLGLKHNDWSQKLFQTNATPAGPGPANVAATMSIMWAQAADAVVAMLG